MRELTVDEKALIRTGKQSTLPRLAISNPDVVFRARVNQTFDTKDRVLQVTYDQILSALTVDSTSTHQMTGTAVLGKDGNHTCAADASNLFVKLALRGISALPTGVAVTYDGVAMSLVQSEANGNMYVGIFHLAIPAIGTNVISASWTNTAIGGMEGISFIGGDTNNPYSGANDNEGSATSGSVVVTSAVGHIVIDAIAFNGADALTVGAGQTQIMNFDNDDGVSDNVQSGGSREDGAASVTMSWACGGSHAFVIVACSVRPGAGRDGGGPYTDVIPGMTALIGTENGGFDKGIVRIRKELTSTIIYIGETSEIDWEDNLFITIIEDFNIWSKLITIVGPDDIRVDGDVVFPNEWGGHQRPVIRIGPAAFVLERVNGVATLNLSADVYSPMDLEITEYLCEVDGATVTDEDTANPIIEIENAGEYLLKFTATDELDFSSTVYRKIFVDPVSPEVRITRDPEASRQSGGWSFEVEAWSNITPENIHDKTLVILWAHDYYDDVRISIGPIEGQEHVIAIGWISEKSIEWNPDYSSVRFRVEGAQYWLDNIYNKPAGVVDTSDNPISWVQIPELTVDKGLFHLLYWRSTTMSIMDCYLTEDTKRLSLLNASGNSIWEQIRTMSELTLKAVPLVNRYGQLYVEVPIQIVPIADRDFPVIMDIEQRDLRQELFFEVRSTPDTSFVEVSGISPYDGTTASPLFSHAPGDAEKHYGRSAPSESNLLFEDQDDCNEKAAMLLSWKNNIYPHVDAMFASNMRMIDICPRHYFTKTINAEDTALGIVIEEQNLIFNRVTFLFDNDSSIMKTDGEFEFEPDVTELSVTYIPPVPPTSNLALPVLPPLTPLPLFPPLNTWFPPFIPNPDEFDNLPEDCDEPSGPYSINWTPSHIVGDTDKNESRAYFPCQIRDGTQLVINFTVGEFSDALSNVSVFAIESDGTPILEGTITNINNPYMTVTFNPVSPTAVAGFSIVLDVGGTGSKYQVFPEVFASGILEGNDSDGDQVVIPVGLWAIESYGGPFNSGERVGGGLEVEEGSPSDTGEGDKWTFEYKKRQGNWTGIFGLDAYGVFRLDEVPSTSGDPDTLAGYQISAQHARVYINVSVEYTIDIRCNDNAIGLTTFPYPAYDQAGYQLFYEVN